MNWEKNLENGKRNMQCTQDNSKYGTNIRTEFSKNMEISLPIILHYVGKEEKNVNMYLQWLKITILIPSRKQIMNIRQNLMITE